MRILPAPLRLHLNAGLSYYDAVICAEKLNDDAVNSLWDIKRLANTSELLKYVKSIGDLDRINNAARKLSDQPPQEKRKGLTRENSSDNSANEKIFVEDSEKFDSESHARMFGWFVSLGIAQEDALQSVNRMVGDGYDTIVDVKLLATQSEDKLMKYFNKLGHVDKVKVASKDTELELHILNEIVRDSSNVTWDDIAGLSFAKGTLREAVILPKLIPQKYSIHFCALLLWEFLLFGPPGTGKTMLAEAVAGSTDATFFSISASSINSKWFGEAKNLYEHFLALLGSKSQLSFL